MPFWLLCCESEAILSKGFVPVTRAAVFIWKNSHPRYRDLGRNIVGRKNRDLVTGFSCEHIEIFTKKRVARRDLGNRASLVDRAHMKRPWEMNLHIKGTCR